MVKLLTVSLCRGSMKFYNGSSNFWVESQTFVFPQNHRKTGEVCENCNYLQCKELCLERLVFPLRGGCVLTFLWEV